MSSVTRQSETDSIWDELASCANLPTPPGVAAQLITLAQQDETTFEDVESLVAKDPVMTAKLLKLANSSLYSRGQTIESLKQAISQFGLNGALIISLTFSLLEISASKETNLDFNRFWLRSLAAAIICKKLSQICKAGGKDAFYLAGLLQDIGILAITAVRPTVYDGIDAESASIQEYIDAEVTAFGVDHSDIGAWLLNEWNFPDKYIEATRHSHTISASNDLLINIVGVSSPFAEFWTSREARITDEIASLLTDSLNVDDEMISKLLSDTAAEINEVAHLFGVSELEDSAISTLLTTAKECLTLRSLVTERQLMETAHRVAALEEKTAHVEKKLDFDDLTGVHARSYAYQMLEKEFTEGEKYKPLAVIFVDLDDFKRINDTFGHGAGDTVLRKAADIMKRSLRDSNVIARIGGEEFLIILPGEEYSSASSVCDRLVQAFSTTEISVSTGTAITVTASIGLAVHCEDTAFDSVDELIATADRACYSAKNNGKNCWRYNQLAA